MNAIEKLLTIKQNWTDSRKPIPDEWIAEWQDKPTVGLVRLATAETAAKEQELVKYEIRHEVDARDKDALRYKLQEQGIELSAQAAQIEATGKAVAPFLTNHKRRCQANKGTDCTCGLFTAREQLQKLTGKEWCEQEKELTK